METETISPPPTPGFEHLENLIFWKEKGNWEQPLIYFRLGLDIKIEGGRGLNNYEKNNIDGDMPNLPN